MLLTICPTCPANPVLTEARAEVCKALYSVLALRGWTLDHQLPGSDTVWRLTDPVTATKNTIMQTTGDLLDAGVAWEFLPTE